MGRKRISVVLLTLFSTSAGAQLIVDQSFTPEQLVQDFLVGPGIEAYNVTFNDGPGDVVHQKIGAFNGVQSSIGLDSGVIMGTGDVLFALGPNDGYGDLGGGDGENDVDLDFLMGGSTNDKAVLEFDFIPAADSVRFRYVFASDEYDAYVCSNWSDLFAVFLSGPGINGPFTNGAINIAWIPGTQTPISINTLNSGVPGSTSSAFCDAIDPNWVSYSNYYISNIGGLTVEYNGYTVVLTASAAVQCGAVYHLKFAIADDSDEIMDSAVFLEAGAFSIPEQVIPTLEPGLGIVGSTINVSCVPVELTFERQGDLSLSETVSVNVSGSAIPGIDYSPALPAIVSFAAGDSTVSFELDVALDDDGPEDIILTITESMGCANTSVSTVYSFNILSPAPLEATGEDVTALCGDVNILTPVITGGVGDYEFLWSTGETTPSIVVSPGITTFYDFTVTNACSNAPYYGTFIVNLPEYDPLEITVSPATEIGCLEEETISVVSATGGNGDYDYSWAVLGVPVGATSAITIASPNAPLWYIVEVTDGCGTSVEDSVLVSPVALDPIVITASDGVALCQGDSIVLQVTEVTGGSGGYTYEWTDPQGAVVGLTNEIQVHVTQDQQFTIMVTDQCGLVGYTTLWARSPVHAPFVLSLTPDLTLCAGDSVELHAVVAGGSGSYSIQWDEAGGAATDPIIVVGPERTTTYSVSVMDDCGAILSDQVEVTVETVEVAILVENLGGNTWHLRSAITPSAFARIWDMGDGVRYRQQDVLHSYQDVEEHWALLSFTTLNGCDGMDSVLLSPPGNFFFPNAFTPDGDGTNDTFGPIGNDIHSFEMTIFNRWGEAIYSTTSLNEHWTGTVNGGELAATGVYVYKYRLEGRYLRALEGVGHVTLLRGTQD